VLLLGTQRLINLASISLRIYGAQTWSVRT